MQHDFLSLSDLTTFIEAVNSDVTLNNSYDTERFESHLVKPSELTEDVLYQLADLVDKKTQFTDPAVNKPDPELNIASVDRISNSLCVAYITEEGIPVAVATLVDPTIENYKGVIPKDLYSVKSAVNLENRLQQEYFVVAEEYKGLGLSGALRSLLEKVSPNMFVTVSVNDNDTLQGVAKNNYQKISQFDTDWDNAPVELWLN